MKFVQYSEYLCGSIVRELNDRIHPLRSVLLSPMQLFVPTIMPCDNSLIQERT
jgi:hypothetical protein